MRILFTGGSGTFGHGVVPLLIRQHHDVWTPSRRELDVTREADWARAVAIFDPQVIVHAAAFTGVDRAETEREECFQTNVNGTRFGLREAARLKCRFVYISTDYVFDGRRGNYEVDDYLGPVNYYGLTKTLAEVAVKEYPEHAIIRTSFAPNEPWRYPGAWEDLYTGKDYIDVLAPEFALAIQIPFRGIVHIVTERKTVFELARRRREDVKPIPRSEARMPLPADVSLSTASWEYVKRCWKRISRSRS